MWYMGEMRGAHRVLAGNVHGKKLLGRLRLQWEDNIEKDLEEVGLKGVEWTDLTQNKNRWRAFVNTVMNLKYP